MRKIKIKTLSGKNFEMVVENNVKYTIYFLYYVIIDLNSQTKRRN